MEADHPSSRRIVNPKLSVYYKIRQHFFITLVLLSQGHPQSHLFLFSRFLDRKQFHTEVLCNCYTRTLFILSLTFCALKCRDKYFTTKNTTFLPRSVFMCLICFKRSDVLMVVERLWAAIWKEHIPGNRFRNIVAEICIRRLMTRE
jgi:hypothetical protein